MAAILIVEDEPTIRKTLCDILSTSHECRAVGTAVEGLELLAAGPFDVGYLFTFLRRTHVNLYFYCHQMYTHGND